MYVYMEFFCIGRLFGRNPVEIVFKNVFNPVERYHLSIYISVTCGIKPFPAVAF